MIVRVEHRDNPFAQIERSTLQDERLSWRARGLLAYLLSLPPDWTINFEHLADQSPDSKYQVRQAFKELRELEYAELVRPRGEDGTVQGSHWVVYESPRLRKCRSRSEDGAKSNKNNDSTEMGKSPSSGNHRESVKPETRKSPEPGGFRPPTNKTDTDLKKQQTSRGRARETDVDNGGQASAVGDLLPETKEELVVVFSEEDVDVMEPLPLLRKLDVKDEIAQALAERHGAEVIRRNVRLYRQKQAAGEARGPGWLVQAIKNDWATGEGELYTHSAAVAELDRLGGKLHEHFEVVPQPGHQKPKFRRIG